MECIRFDISGAGNQCIAGIPNEIFQNHIFPYLYEFPRYFAALPYAEGNRYRLVNKDWAQIKPHLPDLFYHYHIVNRQYPMVCDQEKQLYHNLRFVDNAANRHMLAYLKRWDLGNWIRFCHHVICQNRFDEKMVSLVCTSIIDSGIYYWGEFQFLLQERYHATWLECYRLALKKGSEHKRDLKLISDRYEFNLNIYIAQGNKVSGLSEALEREKKKFNNMLDDGDNEIKPLHILTEKEMYCDRIQSDKNLMKTFFNDCNLRIKIFGSYKEFRNDPIIEYYYQNDKELISDMFYEQFKKKYNDRYVSSFSTLDSLKETIQNDKDYRKDFADYIEPFVKQIIKHDHFSDEQMWLLFYYGMAVFNQDLGGLNNLDEHFQLVGTIPSSFNSQFEEHIFSQNYLADVLYLQDILKSFRKEQWRYRERSEEFYYKLLSLKRIIMYLCRHEKLEVFLFFLSIVCFCKQYGLEKTFEKLLLRIVGGLCLIASAMNFSRLCHARFVY